jgi:hypothetical protein
VRVCECSDARAIRVTSVARFINGRVFVLYSLLMVGLFSVVGLKYSRAISVHRIFTY